jgi:hypothetical protein
MIPVFALTALVMAAAAVAHCLFSGHFATNVLLGTGRHPGMINSIPVGGSSGAQPTTAEEDLR